MNYARTYYSQLHGLGLNGNTVVLTDYIGKYFTASRDISIWTNAPGKQLLPPKSKGVIKAGQVVGTIINIEKASDGKYWAQTVTNGWFNFNAYAPALVKRVVNLPPLTEDQKKDIIINAAKAAAGQNAIAVDVVTTAADVAEGVVDTASSALNVVGWLGRNLKGIAITGGLVLVAYYGYTAYSAVKKIKQST